MIPFRFVKAGTTTGVKTRAYFHLVDATDGITPETGEATGQPQISVDGAAWTNVGIGTLTAIGNGSYYADLTTAIVASGTALIQTRYKSANTAEAHGTTFQVVPWDPYTNGTTETLAVTIAAGGITANSIGTAALIRSKFGDSIIDAAFIASNAFTEIKFADNVFSARLHADSEHQTAHFATAFFTSALTGTGFLTSGAMDATLDTFACHVDFRRDQANTQDRYTVTFSRNGGETVAEGDVTLGPLIVVVTTAGTSKVTSTGMTHVTGKNAWFYAATGSARLATGETAVAEITATIDGTSRTFTVNCGRDST